MDALTARCQDNDEAPEMIRRSSAPYCMSLKLQFHAVLLTSADILGRGDFVSVRVLRSEWGRGRTLNHASQQRSDSSSRVRANGFTLLRCSLAKGERYALHRLPTASICTTYTHTQEA